MSANRTTLTRMLHDYVRPHSAAFVWAGICMIIVAATTAINAWLMQPVLDDIFVARKKDMLIIIPLAVVVLALIKAAASYQQSMTMRTLGQRIISDMQLDLYRHLLDADMTTFHSQSSGSLISRFTNDIILLRESMSNVLTNLAKESLTLIFLVGVMFYQHWLLAIMATVVFPIAILPMSKLGRRMRKVTHNTQQGLGQFTTMLDETFQGIRIIKAYGQTAAQCERAKQAIENVFVHYTKAFRIKSAASPIMEMLAGISIALVIGYGGSQVVQGKTTPGAFFSFIAAMMMAYKPLRGLSGISANLQEGLAAAERVFSMLDVKPAISDAPDSHKLNITTGELDCRNLNFAYNAEKPALFDVSLHVPAGKTAALVGPSGSGKSTMINLLLRFYDADSGTITIDGQNIRDVTLSSLRRNIALVTQETILFDDSVRANLCYGMPEASEDEMMEAARSAEAHEFIEKLPQGYDTQIGQHGVTLSGGQRQRLAIARAMLKNAPILLLDEATSALDPVAEQKIQAALKRLMRGRTTIMIAHRLSTVIDADIIYVMKNGRVVESGTHNSLLNQGGEYARLYAGQIDESSQS